MLKMHPMEVLRLGMSPWSLPSEFIKGKASLDSSLLMLKVVILIRLVKSCRTEDTKSLPPQQWEVSLEILYVET